MDKIKIVFGLQCFFIEKVARIWPKILKETAANCVSGSDEGYFWQGNLHEVRRGEWWAATVPLSVMQRRSSCGVSVL